MKRKITVLRRGLDERKICQLSLGNDRKSRPKYEEELEDSTNSQHRDRGGIDRAVEHARLSGARGHSLREPGLGREVSPGVSKR